MSKLDELERLSRLRATGALSQKEFEAAKEKLLASRQPNSAVILVAVLAGLVLLGAAFGVSMKFRTSPATASEIEAPAVIAPEPAEQLDAVTVESSQESSAPRQDSRVDRLLDPTLLGGNLEYFESISGPARQIYGDLRLYEVDECSMSVGVNGQRILSIAASINQRCNPRSLGRQLNGMTLAQAETRFGRGVYDAECLRSCGNAYDPGYTLAIDGYRANGFTSYLFTAQAVTDADWDRLQVWEDKMLAAEGEDYVIMSRYRCETKYLADAENALRNLTIASVRISSELERPDCA